MIGARRFVAKIYPDMPGYVGLGDAVMVVGPDVYNDISFMGRHGYIESGDAHDQIVYVVGTRGEWAANFPADCVRLDTIQ